ncbi:MAG: hypothetical protein D6687_12345 [Acidobacteria bacterium]|jgi:hypothetical protein|nr:MAG: hypothetical protein D6687_12345 [Acidobacteriota bacterium]GIU82507.1 MAG: hypothetical protein KatS3mg006_1571 [Pyrinomonadaceae bacterium]
MKSTKDKKSEQSLTIHPLIKETILALEFLGAEVTEHWKSPESFGSWHIVFQFEEHILRLVFDGKELVYELQQKAENSFSPQDWEPIAFVRVQTEDKLSVYDEYWWEQDKWLKKRTKTASNFFVWLIETIREKCL